MKTKFKHKYFKLLFLIVLALSYNCAYESENREKLISSFEDNFGFKPPKSIEKIKLKNWRMYDTQVHWMSFTFDQKVFDKILNHDQPLEIIENNNVKFEYLIDELSNDVHHPEWFELPNKRVSRLYYKKDFLKHTFNEYYLWNDKESKMTNLYVHFFD